MKSPCCDQYVHDAFCDECDGHGAIGDEYDEECCFCDGVGVLSGTYECPECGEHYEECDLTQE